jgi:hypothetical protein
MMKMIFKQFENILLDTLNQIEQIYILEPYNKKEIINLLENLKDDIKKSNLEVSLKIINKIKYLEEIL